MGIKRHSPEEIVSKLRQCKSSKDMEQSDLQIKRDIWIVSPD